MGKGEARGDHTSRLQLVRPVVRRTADRRGGDHQQLVEETGLQIRRLSRRSGQSGSDLQRGRGLAVEKRPPWRRAELTGDREARQHLRVESTIGGKGGGGEAGGGEAHTRKTASEGKTSSRTCPVHERRSPRSRLSSPVHLDGIDAVPSRRALSP
jgi:hypothetical protein